MEDDYKKWFTQFRKGYIELCTLLALKRKKSANGSGLISFFNENQLLINEGTLYPLLGRMEENGLLNSNWKIPEKKGRPTKEYQLSQKGETLLPLMLKNYQEHNQSLEKIKGDYT